MESVLRSLLSALGEEREKSTEKGQHGMKPSLRLSALMIRCLDIPVDLAASLIEVYSLDPPSYMIMILFDERGGFLVPLYSDMEKLPPSSFLKKSGCLCLLVSRRRSDSYKLSFSMC